MIVGSGDSGKTTLLQKMKETYQHPIRMSWEAFVGKAGREAEWEYFFDTFLVSGHKIDLMYIDDFGPEDWKTIDTTLIKRILSRDPIFTRKTAEPGTVIQPNVDIIIASSVDPHKMKLPPSFLDRMEIIRLDEGE